MNNGTIGVGTSVPFFIILLDGTEVPTPMSEKNGTEVPTPNSLLEIRRS